MEKIGIMKIVKIIIHSVEIPLRTVFRHALKIRRCSQSIIVEIVTDSGIHGYGEGVPREYVTGESLPGTVNRLISVCKSFKGENFTKKDSFKCFSKKLDSYDFVDAPSARCALELAILDAWGKHTDQRVADQLTAAPICRPIRFSGVISGEDLKTTEKWLYRIRDFGFDQVKLKVGNNSALDMKRLELSRRILGSKISLRIDANGAWKLSEAIENIRRISSLGVRKFEQPLAVKDREDYPKLMEQLGPIDAKIILDESVCSENDAEWFIENNGASGFNIKISKQGGLWPSYRIFRMAKKAGMICQLGCHVGETAILTLAGQSFSTISDDFFAFEGSFGKLLLEHDITKEDVSFRLGGIVNLSASLAKPGLGIEVVQDLLLKSSQCVEV